MPGRLGVDFGTSNTVLAVWGPAKGEGEPLFVPEYARPLARVIPSLIHYLPDGQRWVGQQVLANELYESPQTFRWMKRYITRRSPVRQRIGDRDLSPFDAGRDFLSAVLSAAGAELNLRDEEVVFTVPVEAYEHYEDWLTGVAAGAGIGRLRLIDEASAAALGYGAHIQGGDVYLIFDFGGGTLDVSVVLVEDPSGASDGNGAAGSGPIDAGGDGGFGGHRCRVLGKAGADLGGATLDQWIFEDVLARSGQGDADEPVRQLSRALLVDCERCKEQLSTQDRSDVSVLNPYTGVILSGEYTRQQFEDLLQRHGLFTRIDQTIRRALKAARERGCHEDHVKAALLVGGSSMVPSVQRAVAQVLGAERVKLDRPLDAAARGAAAFAAGVDFFDHIQHDYAIRYINPARGDYDYRPIVRRGTPYPTKEPVARVVVKASHDGQKQLGIAVFELGPARARGQGEDGPAASPAGPSVELVFDPSGAARLTQVSPEDEVERSRFWLNQHRPMFLSADPPGAQGEPRFEVHFDVDENKRLLVTARDLKSGKLTLQGYPMVKLT